jgi:hypothetical protein
MEHFYALPTPLQKTKQSQSLVLIQDSVGFFTAANIHDFENVFEKVMERDIKPNPLWRMGVCVNGKPVPTLVLSDVLFGAENPAETMRYYLKSGGGEQFYKSSGA